MNNITYRKITFLEDTKIKYYDVDIRDNKLFMIIVTYIDDKIIALLNHIKNYIIYLLIYSNNHTFELKDYPLLKTIDFISSSNNISIYNCPNLEIIQYKSKHDLSQSIIQNIYLENLPNLKYLLMFKDKINVELLKCENMTVIDLYNYNGNDLYELSNDAINITDLPVPISIKYLLDDRFLDEHIKYIGYIKKLNLYRNYDTNTISIVNCDKLSVIQITLSEIYECRK